MLEKLKPDRRQDRRLRWFAADALLGVLFVWITVESFRSSAYVTEYGRIEGLDWLLAISPTERSACAGVVLWNVIEQSA